MQQERGHRPRISSLRPTRKTFWLTIMGMGVLLVPIEYILLTTLARNSLLSFPWFISTLSSCFIAGGLCALLTTRHLRSRNIGDFMRVGSLSGLATGTFNVFIWLLLILSNGIYSIYHPAPPLVMIHMSVPTVPLNGWILGIILILFLAIGCFHMIAASIGGLLGGLLKGYISIAHDNRVQSRHLSE